MSNLKPKIVIDAVIMYMWLPSNKVESKKGKNERKSIDDEDADKNDDHFCKECRDQLMRPK